MARRRFEVDDSGWEEVKFINGYAVFVGYLMIGVRGLGLLVITWTTIVVLGGFVSDLGTKDFWCLTGITLVQTAGVFNLILEQTLSDFSRSWWGLLGTASATVIKPVRLDAGLDNLIWRLWVVVLLSGIQAFMHVMVLCPVMVLYVFGIYISAGVGLWRLIEHDFGNTDGAAHLKPALEVLYSLALVQGVVYGYKTIHAIGAESKLAELIAKSIGSIDKVLVAAYLEDTVAGCEKDPSFAIERNLVTYAMDMVMDAKSNEGFIIGVMFLARSIQDGEPGRKVLAKHMLTRQSSPCSQMTQRLLDVLGPRSPYSGMIRVQAARLVAVLVSSIHLEEHPGWIHCISSLLETFEEYSWRPNNYQQYSRLPKEYERGWRLEQHEQQYLLRGESTESTVDSTSLEERASTSSDLLRANYRQLVEQGFNILQKLTIYPNNCRVIIGTEHLLLKIMAPLNNEQLHRDEHDVWTTMALGSYELTMQLVAIPGETGTKLYDEISRSSKSITITLESILDSLEIGMQNKFESMGRNDCHHSVRGHVVVEDQWKEWKNIQLDAATNVPLYVLIGLKLLSSGQKN